MSAVSDPRIKKLGEQAMDMVLPTLIEHHGKRAVPHIQTAGLAVAAALAVVVEHLEELMKVLGGDDCEACDGTGVVEDPSACGDEDHCCPVMMCRSCGGWGLVIYRA